MAFDKKYIKYGAVVVVIIAVFGLGMILGAGIGKKSAVCEHCKPENVDMSLFWEAWDKLKEKYVDPQKFDDQKMIYGAVSGMVNSLGDPYTVFFSPEENKKFMEDVKGSFEGVGMEVAVKKDQLQVVSPIDGTPASKAGLRAGDFILKIDAKDTQNLTVEEAVSLIRGPKGTEVTLSVFRNGWDEPKDFKIIREQIKVPAVKWELKDNKEVAYIKIFQFSEQAFNDFNTAGYEIVKSPAKRIVLDLRNNPGGYLEVAQSIAGWFVEPGKPVVTEDYGGRAPKQEFNADGRGQLANYPIVILVNAGSASASEILAAAIRENRDNSQLAGVKTFGKGLVQEMESLTEGSALKITVARWLTPKGNLIQEKGIEPDVKIEMTDSDYETGKDPQMDKALELVKGIN